MHSTTITAFVYLITIICHSWSSALGTKTKLKAGWVQGSSPVGGIDFSPLQKCPDQLWGPPSFFFKKYKASFQGVKQPRREVNPSPPTHAKVKKVGV
jgi:hypothetical protein